MLKFELNPFKSTNRKHFDVNGYIRHKNLHIEIHYEVTGDIRNLLIPVPPKDPDRAIGLWESTCFEFFLKHVERNDYLEFNFSTSKEWNCFYFEEYRVGKGEYTKFNAPLIHSQVEAQKLMLTANLDLSLSGLFSVTNFQNHKLLAGVATVLETENRGTSFWALKHPPDAKPDFHAKENFILTL